MTCGCSASSSFFFFKDRAPPEFSPFPLPDAFPTPRRYADHGGSRSHRGGIALAAQKLSTSTIAWAKAWGASCGKLCPIPPEMVRCAYLPENLLRSEEHTSELQSQSNLVCRLLLEKK